MNFQLLEYALNSLQREIFKNLFIFFTLTLLTAFLASMLFITSSMKHELSLTLDGVGDIIVSSKKGGLSTPINEHYIDRFLEISGISTAKSRVWGYYYFEAANTHFTLFGADLFENEERAFLVDALQNEVFDVESMIVGEGVLKVLNKSYYKEYFNFIQEDGKFHKLYIRGTFKDATRLESNDMIVMHKNRLKEIFGLKSSEATDIVIDIANKSEVGTIAQKIRENFPHLNLLSKEELRISYENIFNYKSALFLGLYSISIFTFMIIIYDRLSSINSIQKREIGILKALGWSIETILKAKLYEAVILSTTAYLLGVSFSLFFVYILDAPILRDIFIGYTGVKPAFELVFLLEWKLLFLLFFLSVPLYVLATILPSWRVATLDAAEIIR